MRRLRMLASSRSFMRLTSSPAKRYSPLVGTSRHPRMCMSVDFPEQEGPITARKPPSLSARPAAARAARAATTATEAAAAPTPCEPPTGPSGRRWNRAGDGCDHHLVAHLDAAEDLGERRIRGPDGHGNGLWPAVDIQRDRAASAGRVHGAGGNSGDTDNLVDDHAY